MATFLRTPESRFANLPLFPYKPHYVNLPSSKEFRLAYIDESTSNYCKQQSEIFLCLHGVPTYSYLYRKIIPVLLASNKHHNRGVRVICPDFLGWGRSDKPTNASVHTVKFHRQSIVELLQYLQLDSSQVRLTLICQDWGGLIGLTLPMAFMHYSVDDKASKIVTSNHNPIKRIMYFNTTIPLGQMASSAFLTWRRASRNTPDLKVPNLMKYMLPNLSKDEINGYNAPFPDERYKLAIQTWPSNVPIHPHYEGLDTWHKAYMFYQQNKRLPDGDAGKIKLFQAHGCLDRLFSMDDVKQIYKMMIDKQSVHGLDCQYGVSSECGGVLWVPNGSHFLQESPDIEWVIGKALKYFGDVPYDDVEYEWMLSPNTNKVNIVKITLNKPPVNVLSLQMVRGLGDIFEKFKDCNECDGYILTANIPTNRKLAIFCPGYDLSLMAKQDRNLIKQYFYALKRNEYLMHSSKKPILAALNGSVIAGGVLLVLRCDYRIMSDDCFLSMNEVRNAIKLRRGGSTLDFIQSVVGSHHRLNYIFQTGTNIHAEKAKEFGLVDEIVEKRNMKSLLDRSVAVLENDYFPADREAAALVRSVIREEMIKSSKEYAEEEADLYADTFLAPKVQSAIQKLFNKKKKKQAKL